ncbi:azurocidin-like [Cynocephalus volans]|uniref:azurocidin-like n=1 Tax=Cynocephalus volans TaxID=110931 RepID=UPI002FCBA1BB
MHCGCGGYCGGRLPLQWQWLWCTAHMELCFSVSAFSQDREANLTSNVALVPLTQQNVIVEAGTSCQVAGWGTWQTGGHLSCFPRVVNMTVTPKDHCCHNSVCTVVLTHQGGICQCDGGSPLNGLAHGVASFTMDPYSRGPDFFTCVAHFQNRIVSVLNPLLA